MTSFANRLAQAADDLLEDDLRDHHDRCSQQHSLECSCGHTQDLTNALRAAIDAHEAGANALMEACVEFVRKVDEGEAQSVRSYAQMQRAIASAGGVTP